MGTLLSFLAQSALMTSPFGVFLKAVWKLSGKVPWQVWVGLAAAVAIFVGVKWHAHEVHKTYVSGMVAQKALDDAALTQLRVKVAAATTNGVKISQDTRSKNDAQNVSIHAAAAAIGVRGPGAASCRRVSDPAVPATGGRPVAGGDQLPDAAGNSVFAGDGQSDLAAVPFDWLVGRAEQADLDRSEVIAWRDWYSRQSAEWEKLRAPTKP